MENRIFINRRLKDRFYQSLRKDCLIFFSAPSGFGKTASVRKLLEEKNLPFIFISCREYQEMGQIETKTKPIVVLDDIQELDMYEEKVLAAHLEKSDRGWIFLSRGPVPVTFRQWMVQGRMELFERKDLRLDLENVTELLRKKGVYKGSMQAQQLLRSTDGYPLLLQLAAMELEKQREQELPDFGTVKKELFHYYDGNLLCDFPTDRKQFLLKLADFDVFSSDLAAMITGRPDAEKILTETAKKGGFFYSSANGIWQADPLLAPYLREKQKYELSWEGRKMALHNAGLYYELQGENCKALDCYKECGEYEKVIELLTENARQHPGIGHYYEMETYYRGLPENVIEKSPQLMCGMSMLASICMQEEQSEYWYEKLSEAAERLDRKSEDYKQIQSKLLYLDIALPHRGSGRILKDLFRAIKFTVMTGIPLPEFCVTSNIPSLMRGGKDFCKWSKVDRQLYRTVRVPVEKALGRYGAGLGDIAVSESFFEKGEESSYELLMMLNRGLLKAETEGTEEMCFVAKGLMARVYVSQGDIQAACELMETFGKTMKQKNKPHLLPNIEAFKIRLCLLRGELSAAEQWMRQDAPDEKSQFYTMQRYRYLTKVRCYIQMDRLMEALSLLGSLMEFARRLHRTYDAIETGMLTAVCLFRMGEENWQDVLLKALEKAEEFGFTRVFAEEGGAIKPLLENADLSSLSREFYESLIKAVRTQALYYPHYLEPKQKLREPLSKAELEVLRLMAQGMKNSDIADFLGISPNTVKFHIKNVYSKLNVKNRLQALKTAEDYQII